MDTDKHPDNIKNDVVSTIEDLIEDIEDNPNRDR